VVKKNKDVLILRNTLNSSTVKLNKAVKNKIDSVIDGEKNHEVKEYIRRLIKLDFLISLKLDEKKKYLDIFKKHRKKDETFTIYLVLTRNCQLNCPYCFEKGIEKNKFMTIEKAKKIVKWCTQYISNYHIFDKFRVVLYGGEPLLNKKVIRFILPKFYQIAKEEKIEFEHGILTNGVLLDLKILSFLNHYNFDKLQISIDGPKKTHDKRRVGKNKIGTFDRITDNILNGFKKGLIRRLDLRINFDKQNVDKVPLLFDFFARHKLQNKIKLSFGVITSTIDQINNSHLRKFGLNQEENAEKYIWLCREAQKRGFDIPDEYLSGPWCTARKIHSAVIEPDGNLLKCISTVGREKFVFGNINSIEKAVDSRFEKFDYLEECLSKKCPFVPICGGGCRFEAYNESGDLLSSHCQRKMIGKINKNLLKLKF
jgi:uncharacterized protein